MTNTITSTLQLLANRTYEFDTKMMDFRVANKNDALCLGVLSTQVFLDTYATSGINSDLANEVLQIHSPAAFETRLANSDVEITVAQQVDGHLIGYVDLQFNSQCPTPTIVGPEVLRLYVQKPFQRKGLGAALLALAEKRARLVQAPSVWLTAWVGNISALAFYPTVGYEDVGTTQYAISGIHYENRIFAKTL
jgi:diamine N-acetyltransferase